MMPVLGSLSPMGVSAPRPGSPGGSEGVALALVVLTGMGVGVAVAGCWGAAEGAAAASP